VIYISRFAELNINITDLMLEFINNSDLCKLLYYNDNNPLSQSVLTNPVDSLMYKNIYPYPFIPSVETEECSFINLILNNFGLSNNIAFKNGNITVDVIVHTNLWILIDGTMRVFKIMEEIDTILNNQRLAGIGKLSFEYGSLLCLSKEFVGYSLNYKNVDFN